jgi:glycosyltransferase involved in cell wall biosynthesis
VLDIDDAIWLDRSPHAGGHRLAALKGTPRKVRWLASRAETVVAGNELLAEWLAQYSRDVVVIPSLVEHREIAPRDHQAGERIMLGWIGSASTAPSLQRLGEPLRRFAREFARPVELLAVGGRPPRVEGVDVRYEPWSERAEHGFLRSVDIGLMPLADNEWTRGKCSYKALQYMAAGIPVVADDVGISARVIGHEVGGLVARDVADWTDHLRALAADTDLRTQLGAGGRARVARDFSVEAWAPKLAEVLHGHR